MVYCKVDVGAWYWIDRDYALVIKLSAAGVLHAADLSGNARKILVVLQFNSCRAMMLTVHRAQHMRQATAVQILAYLPVLNRNARHEMRIGQDVVRVGI